MITSSIVRTSLSYSSSFTTWFPNPLKISYIVY
nr:MAG TPA: hypothetical protein [Caudoviricetes sp.]